MIYQAIEKLQQVPKHITVQTRFILEGVKSGELKHNQSAYHCGTAHCIAGWHCVLNSKRLGLTYNPSIDDFEEDIEGFDPWDTAQKDWQLTEAESFILFDCNAVLEVQFSLLKYLEAGNRVEQENPNYVYYYSLNKLSLVNSQNPFNKNINSPFLEVLQTQADAKKLAELVQ